MHLTFSHNNLLNEKLENKTKKIEDFNYKSELKNKDPYLTIKNAINRDNLLKNNFMYLSQKELKKRKEFLYKEKINFFFQKFKSINLNLINKN